jgi:uncharacterized Tic20 family protein
MAWRDPIGLIDVARNRRSPLVIRVGAVIAFIAVCAIAVSSIYVFVLIVLASLGLVGGE